VSMCEKLGMACDTLVLHERLRACCWDLWLRISIYILHHIILYLICISHGNLAVDGLNARRPLDGGCAIPWRKQTGVSLFCRVIGRPERQRQRKRKKERERECVCGMSLDKNPANSTLSLAGDGKPCLRQRIRVIVHLDRERES
jgi:hypothetical protein